VWDESLKPILDLLPVGILTLDGGGDLTGANRPALQYLGLDETAVGRSGFLDLVENVNLRKALAAPANGVVQITFPVGGRSIQAEVQADPTQSNGGKVLMMRDVTGVSNMAILRRRFVFDLLHKLRTPLTTILLVLSMTTSGRLDPTRVDFNEVLGMGAEQAERLTGLLSRLKDLFLLETGSFGEDLSLQAVSVSSLVGQVVEDARALAEEKFQTLIVEFPDEPIFATADPETLSRVVDMVLANAIGYTPDAGEVRVTVRGDEDGVGIRIADNGPGIPKDEMPLLFERFRRGTAPEVRSVEGEGLGLFLSRHLLAAQGGSIVLDSEYGEGTTAEITLRRTEADA